MRLFELEAHKVEDVKGITEMLLRDCQPYLNEIGGNILLNRLYRGLTPTRLRQLFGKRDTRQHDRVPMNTRSEMHDRLNVWFNENYGHSYRNGLFVTGDLKEANQYGKVYVIFPIGDFDFIWHKELNDLFTAMPRRKGVETGIEWLEDKKAGFSTTNLTAAITAGNEISLWTEEYYYMRIGLLDTIGKFLL